ncbi:hypothetical protein [Azovibrio restrictus]|uniref:hypothetical protein n=1 Tax=Azovibrio restrictus TaxID=146938 RepID=UPI00041F5416|nr:hypothetical protein [Azovibrio restrictus]MCE1171560.1 hypothetical protein [Azovibrio sp.]MDD3481371.1 hypothetical protein [Azovibrio restrictus]
MLSFLHPAARLLIWLLLAVFLQLAPGPVLVLLGLGLLLAGEGLRRHWWRLFRRTRILLLTLFLVFAYGLPGPSPWGLEWLPSHEGLAEATLHVLRLLVLLGGLAWLLVPLPHQALMGGLWFLLRPFQILGVPMDRSVVRLSLVLEYMEQMPARQGWRQWLAPQPVAGELAPVIVALPPWQARDSACLLLSGGILLAGGLSWLA